MPQPFQTVPLPAERSAVRQFHKVRGCTDKHGFQVIALADDITGLEVHFDLQANNYVPHFPNGACQHCRLGFRPRYRGYIQAAFYPGMEPFVLELTEGASRELHRQRPPGQTFRGKFLHVYRKEGKKQKSMMARICDVAYPYQVPPSFDLWPHLLAFWKLLDDRGRFVEENRTQSMATVGHLLGELSVPVKE